MSELSNPLFDNERELLERQKEEYKNALMGDVEQIKSQSQEIGKKVAIAGGVLLAGFLIRRMFSGGEKKKTKKVKKGAKDKDLFISHTTYPPASATLHDYDSMVHEQEDAYTLSSERMHHAHHQQPDTGVAKPFMSSELVQMITHQLAALLMVYLTKKVEEYLSSVSKNHDIAARPIEVTEVQTTEYIIPEEDAI
ncbi:hypothetical protein [Pontibacter ruber]|uniref:Uncharacterized protein n=1 Tax=Pontibacter ruber TaxID=1343895 RepID=A0ABW5CXU2_9BACT|nr:hypothetical protein [Pontibacter ruber]